MVQRWMSSFAASPLIMLAALAVMSTISCRKSFDAGDGGESGPASEPEQYSAVVVRIVDDGTRREASITRETRSGEKRREEWMEQNQNRALIWRPDLGKSYLLDLDRRIYVEREITAVGEESGDNTLRQGPADPTEAVQAMDRALDERPAPSRIETRTLPDETIDDHICKVYEHRASFPDGQAEVTRTFRAPDFDGLALKVEAISEHGTLRVITERREVTVEVPLDAFTVPSDFKRVEKLSQ